MGHIDHLRKKDQINKHMSLYQNVDKEYKNPFETL